MRLYHTSHGMNFCIWVVVTDVEMHRFTPREVSYCKCKVTPKNPFRNRKQCKIAGGAASLRHTKRFPCSVLVTPFLSGKAFERRFPSPPPSVNVVTGSLSGLLKTLGLSIAGDSPIDSCDDNRYMHGRKHRKSQTHKVLYPLP